MSHASWLTLHLVVLSAWAGLVGAETVLEVTGRRRAALGEAVARFHYWIDVLVELPLLAGVLVTGAVLLSEARLDALLWVKVGAGLGAVAANGACAVAVIARQRLARSGASEAALAPLTRRVFRTAIVGGPLALVALWLGGERVGWW